MEPNETVGTPAAVSRTPIPSSIRFWICIGAALGAQDTSPQSLQAPCWSVSCVLYKQIACRKALLWGTQWARADSTTHRSPSTPVVLSSDVKACLTALPSPWSPLPSLPPLWPPCKEPSLLFLLANFRVIPHLWLLGSIYCVFHQLWIIFLLQCLCHLLFLAWDSLWN